MLLKKLLISFKMPLRENLPHRVQRWPSFVLYVFFSKIADSVHYVKIAIQITLYSKTGNATI